MQVHCAGTRTARSRLGQSTSMFHSKWPPRASTLVPGALAAFSKPYPRTPVPRPNMFPCYIFFFLERCTVTVKLRTFHPNSLRTLKHPSSFLCAPAPGTKVSYIHCTIEVGLDVVNRYCLLSPESSGTLHSVFVWLHCNRPKVLSSPC